MNIKQHKTRIKGYAAVFVVLVILSTILSGCSRFLDEKSDSNLATPTTLEDNQALLDRIADVLSNFTSSGMASSDEFYLSDADFDALDYQEDKRLYTWQKDYVSTNQGVGNDWFYCYKAIYISNAVLHNLETYSISGAENVRGQALALRAIRYLDAAQIWCLAYNSATAQGDLGLPLRLDPDMNIPSVRSSVKQTYDQILKDLHEAVNLLPVKQVAATRPSKVAALGYLARTYLFMGDYDKALNYSLQALSLQNTLMDFNALNPTDSYPIKDMNSEVLLRATMRISGPVRFAVAKIPVNLYQSYDGNDLRKSVYFRVNPNGEVLFKGNYTGGSTGKMTGVTIDELYLIAAESYAKTNDITNSMKMLNDLLATRWKTGTFTAFTASSKEEALQLIKEERQKELLFRGLRWADLKRYNRDGAGITLTRTVKGQTYSISPNDLRYAIAIPEDIIKLTGMPQNIR
ncbi:RagB/SusD family nutrient uptake outer membrane protein [Chryseobacterium rhizoplanae]|uniref:RagB/SusD family nutrient uptake outer membrane protein n=1 Tax=Chryseobacterium rhizoplanae TaxID=1609531 RepID=UPI001CE2DF70|nr:RagB/SusD family nutrient uptake outer membrane protein [Chryseobacterium rhizoplanae]UCA58263.1 RagB/SusD family nutrient uptake outer membrane protein [Chryseobacterium rhizoplanae]